jgi:DNA sulfur modification protein DndD
MIIDSIVLENFGAYGGRQEANLTPSPDKPIILFGGMNGGGKTTLLDALQLGFYGPKARISNRGRLGYKEYLRESIHRNADPGEGSSITIRFRRIFEGETRHFELQRFWREGVKGIEETVRILRDGLVDDIFTEHWEETVENYLPSGIAHLFFFDGEQIKDLAEGRHAAEILGTAVHSLLGLDLVDRLETDLKVFERRKKAEDIDPETAQKLAQVRGEYEHIDQEIEKLALKEGRLVNEAGRLGKELREREEEFRKEGGELFLRRRELEEELVTLKSKKAGVERELRELIAGPLPLLLVEDLLAEAEEIIRHESEIKRARLVLEELEVRDEAILETLKELKIGKKSFDSFEKHLEEDRNCRVELASEELLLDADETLAHKIAHLRGDVLPLAEQQAQKLKAELVAVEDKITRTEEELERVPTEDRIAHVQAQVKEAKSAHDTKMAELESLRVRKGALLKQKEVVEARLDKLGLNQSETQIAEDDRLRLLRHSHKVRHTLGQFRERVIRRHAANMEVLMLESFRNLLRKSDLVHELTIDPTTFEVTLSGRDGKKLPFDRLSAGERQLLATSLLWGLARASGRPVPTVIDTPLGRLDSSHRRHLIERYFPCASHQVLLLSTDEEIVASYYEELKPYITRTYLLDHDEDKGKTQIVKGYFKGYEAAS